MNNLIEKLLNYFLLEYIFREFVLLTHISTNSSSVSVLLSLDSSARNAERREAVNPLGVYTANEVRV
jgi:hypothetical protein